MATLDTELQSKNLDTRKSYVTEIKHRINIGIKYIHPPKTEHEDDISITYLSVRK